MSREWEKNENEKKQRVCERRFVRVLNLDR